MFPPSFFHLPKTPAEWSDLTQNNAPGFIHICKAGEATAVNSCLWFCSIWTESGIWEKSGLICWCVIICVEVGCGSPLHPLAWRCMKYRKQYTLLLDNAERSNPSNTRLAWKEKWWRRSQRLKQLSCTILHKLRIWSFSHLGTFK